jgi:hypothetical protein
VLNAAEALRSPESMTRPDPRTPAPKDQDQLSLTKHHEAIAAIRLCPGVPEVVRFQFETVRNLYLYAWHVYRFYMVALSQVLSTLELGLRTCLPARLPEPYQPKGQKQPMLAGLLGYAIDRGLIRNEGFRRWHEVAESRARQRRELDALRAAVEMDLESFEIDDAEPVEITTEDRAWNLVDLLRESLPYRRNKLAHGSSMLTSQVLGTIELVAEIINQLYETPSTEQRDIS